MDVSVFAGREVSSQCGRPTPRARAGGRGAGAGDQQPRGSGAASITPAGPCENAVSSLTAARLSHRGMFLESSDGLRRSAMGLNGREGRRADRRRRGVAPAANPGKRPFVGGAAIPLPSYPLQTHEMLFGAHSCDRSVGHAPSVGKAVRWTVPLSFELDPKLFAVQ